MPLETDPPAPESPAPPCPEPPARRAAPPGERFRTGVSVDGIRPCRALDAEIVEALVRRGRVTPQAAARARTARCPEGIPCALTQVAALIGAGEISAAEAIRTAIEAIGAVDFDIAAGIPYAPALLRVFPRDLAARLPVLPTIEARPGGPVIVLAPGPLAPADHDRVALALESSIAVLPFPEPDLRRAIDEAYSWCAERRFHRMRLGEILVRDGLVRPAKLEEALAVARRDRRHLGEVLLEDGAIDEVTLYRLLAAQHGLRLVSAGEVIASLDPELCAKVPRHFIEHNRVIPYRREDKAVRAAATDPSFAAGPLAERLGAEVHVDLITPSEFARAFAASAAPAVAASAERLAPVLEDREPGPDVPIGPQFEALADRLILAAIRARASDLHLETYDGEVVVRLRIDGVLHDFSEVPLTLTDLRGVINVIKIRANMDIAEHRLPQGGRMRRRTPEGVVFDFRIQTQPSLHGEHLVARLLSQSAPLISLPDLGFAPAIARPLERLIASAGGLIVVAGPTGSGKTTTLYAILDRLRASRELKIITAEDPIEYALDRVQQTQVHPEIGYTFASALRAFLREDPDVILIGETRDLETAIETVRASQTGHLVLTTLHANDAVESIRRLLDIGLDAPSVASELLAVLAQRLVRRVCAACRETYAPRPDLMAELWPKGPPEGAVFTRGSGCGRCRGTGYRGRVAVAELWETDEATRAAIAREEALPGQLRDIAFAAGRPTMTDDACAKVLAGLTTVEEAVSALPYAAVSYRRDRIKGG
jgi:type IV pilus assembly protein PilB